jgi:hypothetical protein
MQDLLLFTSFTKWCPKCEGNDDVAIETPEYIYYCVVDSIFSESTGYTIYCRDRPDEVANCVHKNLDDAIEEAKSEFSRWQVRGVRESDLIEERSRVRVLVMQLPILASYDNS